MHLIQLLLPLYGRDGQKLGPQAFAQTRSEIVERFGGLTAYTRAPASGLWQEDDGATVHDELVIYEVMSQDFDEAWWKSYRALLERRFDQEQLVARAQQVQVF
jgi:hypothetical protein